MEERLEKLAKDKVEEHRNPPEVDLEAGGHVEQEPDPGSTHFNMNTFQACLDDLAKMKTWLVESFSSCVTSPDDAAKALQAFAKSLLAQNPALSEILGDLGIDLEADCQFNWGELGKQICKLEQERLEIKKDLESTGMMSRRRGRPFGSKASGQQSTTGEEDGGQDGSQPPTKRTKRSKPNCKDKGKGDLEDDAGNQPPPDPEGIEDDQNKANKCITIPLHSKCLVVETAKKVKKEGNVVNIEKEVMGRFKKYFFSPELNRWKTGLLSKWCKRLGTAMDTSVYTSGGAKISF